METKQVSTGDYEQQN